MKDNGKGNLVITAALQLLSIVLTCILSYYFSRHFNLIPRSVMHLPSVYISHADMWNIVKIFVVTYLIQLVISLLVYKTAAFISVARFANEYVFYLIAYTTASLYTFVATTINYDPQFIAAIGLFSTIAYLTVFVLFYTVANHRNISTVLSETIFTLGKRFVSLSGIVTLAYFLTPLIMGKAFTSDRDIANQITQIRIWFNPVPSTKWGFKNIFPGQFFAQPILVKHAPNDQSSLYVLERTGRIYQLPLHKSAERILVLDIRNLLGEVEVENGALGLAFHPEFNSSDKTDQFVYLYYTDTRPQGSQLNKLSRFDLSSLDLQQRQDSELVILEMSRVDDGFHNGGSIEFGPDGFLYIGLGEGVHPKGATTSAEVFRAGILRLDVDMDPKRSTAPGISFNHGIAQNYLVPKDNPFIGNSQIMDEYWALGLRNPFRFSFDPQTGELWAGDVGSTVWEEVNLIKKGKHYQYPVKEGRESKGKKPWETLDIPQLEPIFTYEHNAYDRAVIGGIVYRGDNYPDLKDKYVFADNYSAKLFVMETGLPVVDEVELIARANQYAQRGISSVVQLGSGEILVTTLGEASSPGGEILQLVSASEADVVKEPQQESQSGKGYDEKKTASLFAVNCARCHGITGDGKGPDSTELGVTIADFTSPLYQFKTTAAEIREVINKGGAQTGRSPMMPPWGSFLKPDEIEHLVIFVKSLPDKHHHH